MSKSQITVYIIIGLIIIVSVVMIFYVKRLIIYDRLSQNQEDTSAVNNYIESFVEDASVEAIFNASKHGGYIDSIDRTLYKEPDGVGKVAIGIIHIPRFMYGSYLLDGYRYALQMPLYPWPAYPESIPNDQISSYVFGKITLPSLMNWTDSISISKEIERYINQKVEGLDLNQVFGNRYTIQQNGAVKSSVLFTDDSLLVTLYYPITLKSRVMNSTASLSIFHIKMPCHFKNMYDFISDILVHDNSDNDFNLSSDYTQLSSYSSDYHLDVHADFETGYDLIEIKYQTDNYDRLNGLVFNIIRENRIPALLPLVSKESYNLNNINLGSFCTHSDEILNYIEEPKAKDPDEDQVFIRYEPLPGCNYLNLDEDSGHFSISCPSSRNPAKSYACRVRVYAYDESEEEDEDYQEINLRYTCNACCNSACGVCTPCSSCCSCKKPCTPVCPNHVCSSYG